MKKFFAELTIVEIVMAVVAVLILLVAAVMAQERP
jgi:hypothetical protein